LARDANERLGGSEAELNRKGSDQGETGDRIVGWGIFRLEVKIGGSMLKSSVERPMRKVPPR
jgi:hypothetical protein